MPHIIIEYSSGIEKQHPIDALMDLCHQAAKNSGHFTENDIKVRAYPCHQALVAGKNLTFVHITLKLLSGRDAVTKKLLTNAILAVIQNTGLVVSSLTVEAVDIERESYSKVTNF